MKVNFLKTFKRDPLFTIRHGLIVFSIVTLFSFPVITDIAGASNIDASVILDVTSLQKGYTVSTPDEQFKIGILPESIQETTVVIDMKNVTAMHQLLPIHKNLVSDVFLYDVQNAKNFILETPMMLSVKIHDKTKGPVHLYYWDKTMLSWKQLPSAPDVTENYVQAPIPFAASLVAAFSSELIVTNTVKNQIQSEVEADSYILIDKDTNTVLLEKDSQKQRPIASLSKIMTSLVFLDHNPGWSKEIAFEKEDFVGGASLSVRVFDIVSVKDLFYATLIGSKNNAAMALARSTGLTKEEFVNAMNEKAKELGMTQTSFVEPTGLSPQNKSTASDLGKLAMHAFSHEILSDISSMKDYDVHLKNTNKYIHVKTTNKLLHDPVYHITASKTGFTNEANHCLMTELHLESGNLISIVLGSPKMEGHFQDTKTIFNAMMLENN